MKVQKTASTVELAEQLLQSEFASEESVGRHNTLLWLGGGGEAQLAAERRRWAEAWQLLEQGRLICREPDESRGSGWFLTGAGKQALIGGDIAGSLMLAGVQL